MKKLDMSRFAVMNMIYKFHSFEYFLDNMVELGVDKVNLWGGHPQMDFEHITDTEVKEQKRMMKQRGIQPICFTPEQVAYAFNIADNNPVIRKKSIESLFRCVDIAAQLETGIIQLVPGWGLYDSNLEDAWKRSRDALASVSEVAGKAGLTVILEPLQIVESNLVIDVKSARRMMDEVHSPYMKLMVDTTHMAVKGETLPEYFKEFGSDIIHIHFNESGQIQHGLGNLPLAQYMDEIEAHDFAGYLTLEMCARKLSIDPRAATETALKHIRFLISQRQ